MILLKSAHINKYILLSMYVQSKKKPIHATRGRIAVQKKKMMTEL